VFHTAMTALRVQTRDLAKCGKGRQWIKSEHIRTLSWRLQQWDTRFTICKENIKHQRWH